MTDKELIYQILNREISNLLNNFNPSFRLLAPTITNYIMNTVDPYINAFTNADGELNAKAAAGYLKEETNRKIEDYLRKFEKDSETNKESK